MTKESEAVVAQYSWLKRVSGRVTGVKMCVFRSAKVDVSVDAVVIL